MEEGGDADAPDALNLTASPIFSPFDFRYTRTPEEMALFDRYGDDYQEVVAAMDSQEQHNLKRAIKFEVPNNPTVNAAFSEYFSRGLLCYVLCLFLGAPTEARTSRDEHPEPVSEAPPLDVLATASTATSEDRYLRRQRRLRRLHVPVACEGGFTSLESVEMWRLVAEDAQDSTNSVRKKAVHSFPRKQVRSSKCSLF